MLGGWVKAQGGGKQAEALVPEDLERLGGLVMGHRAGLH